MREIDIIKRAVYDGDYDRAIIMLCNIVQEQSEKIEELSQVIKENKNELPGM